MLLLITYSADHNKILHMLWHCYCRDMCKISLWSVEDILNHSTPNFYQILNSVETLFMEWVPARVIGKFNDNDGIINHKTLNGTKV